MRMVGGVVMMMMMMIADLGVEGRDDGVGGGEGKFEFLHGVASAGMVVMMMKKFLN